MALAHGLVALKRTVFRRSLISFCTSPILQHATQENSKKIVPRVAPDSTPSTSIKSKVKQGVTDFWYSSIIIGGVALTGFIFYFIVNELFSSQSPTRVYEEALKICVSDPRVQDMFGTPITGCGESNRRGRRTHIASSEWVDTHGKKHLAMRFYLKGVYASGTVRLELYETDSKELVYRYLVVEEDGLSRRQVILRPEESGTTPTSVLPPPPPPSTLEPFDKDSK